MSFSKTNLNLESARKALKDGKLEEAESSFAEILRDTVEPADQVASFVALGDIYQQRGKPACFPKACGLYRAALIKCKEQSICQEIMDKLAQTEAKFLQLYAKPGASCGDSSWHKKLLKDIQDELKDKLTEIPTSYQPGQETLRANEIRKISVDTGEAIKKFFGVLFQECLEAIGEVPCKYAVIGLGSLARKETTPYSDIEFAILLEEGQDSEKNRAYFRVVTHYLHIKVVNLGTTILPALGISSLNDFYGGEDWFYDDFTPRGLAFDGAMPWASKIPTGRGATETKEALELIQTPMKMAAFQKVDSIIKEGYHLADVLSCTTLLHGEEWLLEDYQEEVQKFHQEKTAFEQCPLSTGKLYGINMLLSDVFKYDDKPLYDLDQAGKLLAIKQEVYRMLSTLLQGLSMYFGVTRQSSWGRIEALEEQEVLTPAAAKNLLIACSIAVEFRLRAYCANGSQKEKMSVVPQELLDENSVNDFFQIPDQQLLFRFYYTALPFRDVLEEALVSIGEDSTQVLNIARLLEGEFFDDSNKVQGLISHKLMRYEEAIGYLEKAKMQQSEDYTVYMFLGNIFHQIGMFKEAMENNEAALAIARNRPNDTKADVAKALDGIGRNMTELGMLEDAVKIHKEAIKLHMGTKLLNQEHLCVSYINLGLACEKLGELSEAEKCLTEAMRILREELGIKETHHLKDKILNNLGTVEFDRDKPKAAAEYFEKSLAMKKVLYGNLCNSGLMKCLSNLGSAYAIMGQHYKAISIIRKSLALKRSAFGGESNSVSIAITLINLASAYMKVDEVEKSLNCAMEAKSLLQPVSHQRPREWAYSVAAIARAEQKKGNYSSATELLVETIETLQNITEHNSSIPGIIAILENELRNCLGMMLKI